MTTIQQHSHQCTLLSRVNQITAIVVHQRHHVVINLLTTNHHIFNQRKVKHIGKNKIVLYIISKLKFYCTEWIAKKNRMLATMVQIG